MSTRYQVILGSGSPRRQQLLANLGIRLTIITPDIDETPLPHEPAEAYVERLARAKAQAAAQLHDPDGSGQGGNESESTPYLVIAADTIVALDGDLLGKPADDAEATTMLTQLSGRTHHVHTGVAVLAAGTVTSSVTTTEVQMVDLSTKDIAWYVATGEPADKAGAYGIQDQGGRFITQVKGNYQNVVGLPLTALDQLLKEKETNLTALSKS